LSWREDIDPEALPPTPHLTVGQRRVLTACLEQFATKGFVASSTRDIAASVGMQSPSLYNHFASKEAMLSALVLTGFEYYNERVLAALVAADSHPVAQLSAVVREHILVSCEYPRVAVVIQQELSHLPNDALATALGYRNQAAALVEQILRRGNDGDVFKVNHMRTTISALGSMGLSAATTFPFRPELVATDYADEFVDLALRLAGICEHSA
jgi:AcrR family transcriptional regulator